jgi:hypothetical protein
MTWGFYLIVFWFVFLWTSPNFGAAWEGTSASGRTATRGSIALAGTKVNGCNVLEAHWVGRKSDHSHYGDGYPSPAIISLMLAHGANPTLDNPMQDAVACTNKPGQYPGVAKTCSELVELLKAPSR